MSKDLVGDALADMESRREDAWAALKKMHDQANGIHLLEAAQGWCAPSSAVYSQVPVMIAVPELTEELTKVPEWYL